MSSTGRANGSSSSMRLLGRAVGNFSKVSLSHAAGSIPLSFAQLAAFGWQRPVDRPAREPANNPFFLPRATAVGYFHRIIIDGQMAEFPHSGSTKANVSRYNPALLLSSLPVSGFYLGSDEPFMQGLECWLALLQMQLLASVDAQRLALLLDEAAIAAEKTP